MDTKRLFFGMAIKAPWPEKLPFGRLLDESHRHLTLAFLGAADYPKMKESLSLFPQPNFKVGFAAKFDQCLFLPIRHPRVVAWHVEWFEAISPLLEFQSGLIEWLRSEGFSPDTRHPFNPHVTLCRSPFNKNKWRKRFMPLPLVGYDIHLYESVGDLQYEPVWTYSIPSPFEELEHTADLAYLIRGESFDQLFQHAFTALAFHFPPLLPYSGRLEGFTRLEDVIMELNSIVSFADGEIGCPYKAVSFHSDLETKNTLMQWEMIIDV